MRPLSIATILTVAVLLAGCREERVSPVSGQTADAIALLDRGEIDAAAVALREAQLKDGRHPHLRAALSRVAASIGDVHRATLFAHGARQRDPLLAEGWIASAELAAAEGDTEAALRYTGMALNLAPESTRALTTRAQTLWRLGNREQAFRRLMSIEPRDRWSAAVMRHYASFALADRPNRRGAGQALSAMLDASKRGSDLPTRAVLAAQDRLGDPASAVRLLSRRLRQPGLPAEVTADTAAMMARRLIALGQLDAAEEALRVRLMQQPQELPTVAAIAHLVLARKGLEAAETVLEASCDRAGLAGDAPERRRMRAELLFLAGERDAALETLGLLAGSDAPVYHTVDAADLLLVARHAGPEAALEPTTAFLSRTPQALRTRPVEAMRTATRLVARVLAAPMGPEATHKAHAAAEELVDVLLDHPHAVGVDPQLLTALATLRARTAPKPQLPDAAGGIVAGSADEAHAAALRLSNVAAPQLKAFLAHLDATGRAETADTLAEQVASDRTGAPAYALIYANRLIRRGEPAAGAALARETLAIATDAEADAAIRVIAAAASGPDGDEAARGREEARTLLATLSPAWPLAAAHLASAAPEHLGLEDLVSQALRVLPGEPRLHSAAIALARREGPGAERAAIDAAIEALAENANFRLQRALILERTGDLEGALAEYRILHALKPDALVVINNMASLMAETRGAADETAALGFADELASRLDGLDVPEFLDTRGAVSLRLGEHEAAISLLEKAAQRLPSNPTVHYHLGIAYYRSDMKREAAAVLRRVVALEWDEGFRYGAEVEAMLADLTAQGFTDTQAE